MSLIVHPQYAEIPLVKAVRIVSGFTVHLTFADGVERDIDLEPYLRGPIFEQLRRDPQAFAAVYVDLDTIAWPNGADIAPETLYYDGEPPWAGEPMMSVAVE